MKTSVIRYRVADFLREHPPFDSFSLEDLLTFSGGGRVIFHEDNIIVFQTERPTARPASLDNSARQDRDH